MWDDAEHRPLQMFFRAIPHNSKCRYGERGAADAKPKAQIILDAAKVSAASGGNSEPKQGQRSQSARGFCPRSTMRVPQPDIIEHFGNADAVPQPLERCLSRKAGIVRCCLRITTLVGAHIVRPPPYHLLLLRASRSPSPQTPAPQITTHPIKKPPFHLAVRPKMWYSILSKVLLCPNHSKYFSLFLLIRRNIHAKHSDCIRKYNLCRRK